MFRWMTMALALGLVAGCERYETDEPEDITVNETVDDQPVDRTDTDRGVGTQGTMTDRQNQGVNRPMPAGTSGQISEDTRQFLRDAISNGKLEVELGRLATEKAEDDKVKELGQQMVRDHQQINQQLDQVARQHNVQVTEQLNSEDQQILDELKGLSGDQFNQEWTKTMIETHEKAIEKFQQQARNQNTVTDVRNLAQQTTMKLQEHLQMAQSLARDIGVETEQSGSNSTP